ncbi:phage tail assembly chaperone [Sandarakinorhabdus glacialis]|nr:phage tail assembly chaperone [Polymorphobacter glacialis]
MSLAAMRFEAAARQAARVAAALLGWRPGEFWAATPEDLRNALGLGLDGGATPATGELLARLMEAFPDER